MIFWVIYGVSGLIYISIFFLSYLDVYYESLLYKYIIRKYTWTKGIYLILSIVFPLGIFFLLFELYLNIDPKESYLIQIING